MSKDRVFLVRHAKAGSRSNWDGEDLLRPLSKPGLRQARRIARFLEAAGIAEVRSSPSVRCVDTVAPLAELLGLRVVDDPTLAEGATTADALARLRSAPAGTVACSHGDVIPAVLQFLAADGLTIDGDAGWQKGSIWILERQDGRFVRVRYVPPPGT